MLPIAKILKSNGIDGDVLIGLLDIEASEINTEEPVFIVFDGLPVPFFIERLSPKGSSRAIVHLTDTDSLTDAEELVGREICLDIEYEDDGFEDFTGWTLYDGETLVGEVTGLEDIPGNPCLEIEGGTLIPCPDELIVKVDNRNRKIWLEIADGLL
jgi:ribosomal 30S subunit maturation factor RimM